jgi:hypothetical protein
MTVEASHLSNSRFLHDLGNWTASGASYSAGDGDEQYGVAVLSVGGFVSQQFTVEGAKLYTVHLSVKAVGASLSGGQATLTITDGAGNTVVTQSLSGTADTWTEQTYTLGLAQGTTYTLKITNVSAASQVKVDDVWLWYVPMTRAAVAARVHTKLGLLATDMSYTTTSSGALTEGSYTYAIDTGLRQSGAIDPMTDEPDIRRVSTWVVDTLLSVVEFAMLERLQRDYATMTDITVGQRSERLSQIASAIDKLKGAVSPQGTGILYAGRETSFLDQTGIALLNGGW